MKQTDTILTPAIADSVSKDTLQADSVHPAIVFEPLEKYYQGEPRDTTYLQESSWLLLALLVLLVAIGFKLRNSKGYLLSLIHNAYSIRQRNNMFDNTVRETSFLLLLNTVTLCSGGLMLYLWINGSNPTGVRPAVMCIGLAMAYGMVMAISYYVVGWTFLSNSGLEIWYKGHTSSQGILSLPLLPMALVALAEPTVGAGISIAAFALFVFAKIIFIYKGIRIFITSTPNLFLFFYYLCSLEIVPLIIVWMLACNVCELSVAV